MLRSEMSSFAHQPAAFAIRTADPARTQTRIAGSLSLRGTEDGWSLIAADGEVVFRALGVGGRRQCLEFARARGVLAVLS